MHIAAILDLTARGSVMLALSLAVWCASIAVSQAQPTSTPSPLRANVEELIKLLDDPEIKAWITTRVRRHPLQRLLG